MDTLLIQATIWTTVIVIVYGVFSRGLFRAGETRRQQALDLAVELTESGALPEDDVLAIHAAVADMHSARKAWGVAWTAILVTIALPMSRHKATLSLAGVELPAEIQEKYLAFVTAWLAATVSNSPAAAFIYNLTTITSMAFHVSGVLLSATILKKRTHDHRDHQATHVQA